MKQGQINQIFIYVFALFVIGALVLIAVRGLGGILEDKCNADLINFKDDLKKIISDANSYGSVDEHRFILPCKYDEIVFINTSLVTDQTVNNMYTPPPDMPFVIKDSIESMAQTNVFLVDGDTYVEAGYIEQIQIGGSDPVLRVAPATGSFTLRMKGLGRTTLIAEKP